MTTISERAITLVNQVEALGDEASRIFTHFDGDEVLREAHRLDEQIDQAKNLPLYGKLVSLKDLFDEAGKRTTAGSRLLANRDPATNDADTVARLKAAGALIIGRTSMSEFAYSGVGFNPHHGTPGNAFDGNLVPGGSSSGAAVSAARGLCDIAMGTDTGGSVRLPAALNGLYGFKPSRQVISLSGVYPLSATFDSVGPLCPTHALAQLCFDVLRNTPVNHEIRHAPQTRLRIGIPQGAFTNQLEGRIAGDFESIKKTLVKAGHELIPLDLEFANTNAYAVRNIVANEAYTLYSDYLTTLESIGDPHILRRMRFAESLSDQDIVDSQELRQSSVDQFDKALVSVDAMIAPTVAIETPTLSAALDDFDVTNPALLRNTSMINLVNGCAMSLPVKTEDASSPAALMVAGPNGDDDKVLSVSQQLDRELNTYSAGA